MDNFNELPSGIYGRHGYFFGDWSESHAKYLSESKFPMVTLEGNWGDLSFLDGLGESIRWLRVINKSRQIKGVEKLGNLETLIVGFEPKNISSILEIPKLNSLEIVSKNLISFCSIGTLEKLKIVGAEDGNISVANNTLRELDLISPRSNWLGCVSMLVSLESLTVHGAKGLQNIDFISGAKALKIFMAESCHKLKDVQVLSSLKSIQKISIVRCPIDELGGFHGNTSLQFLHVGGFPIRIRWDDLLSVKTLQRIVVYICENNSTEDEIVSAVRSLGRVIEKLSITGKKNKLVDVVLSA